MAIASGRRRIPNTSGSIWVQGGIYAMEMQPVDEKALMRHIFSWSGRRN
jgi:hypothetical protein